MVMPLVLLWGGLAGAAHAQPLLLALPDGVYVDAASAGAAVRAYPGTVTVASAAGDVTLRYGEPVSAPGCALAAVWAGGRAWLSREGLACLGVEIKRGDVQRPAPEWEPQLNVAPAPVSDVVRIVLDPGHGGYDSGARGVSGAVEKDITLLLARRLRDKLAGPGFEVFLTREDDRYLPLRERAAFANRLRADLFVSIHCNSGRRLGARGIEVFFAGRRAVDDDARLLAEVENGREDASFAEPADSVSAMLSELAVSEQMQFSARVAERVVRRAGQSLGVEVRGVKQAPFWVLLGSDMPAVLVEAGFVTNPEEGVLLGEPEYQARLAAALADALGQVRESFLSRRVRTPDAKIANSRSEAAPPPEASRQLEP
jgi:N-acetylmuramoyl-L-alanine amidase